ncbi:hypothetical protein PG994_004403 [Apiospora phragmitis]|uniref:Uncharacterized protein n=1 Tax=Apiospora phragmitis TaxID=2905665 RepID=A0ABR1VUC9_9PEZI
MLYNRPTSIIPTLLLRRRSALTAAVAWLYLYSAGALGALVFVNPAQKFEGDAVDFATNPVHPVSSNFKVEWTTDEVLQSPLSLLLFQNNSPPEDAEYIFLRNMHIGNITFPNKKGIWQWTVVTNQTLDHSNVFSFSLFFEGNGNPRPSAGSSTSPARKDKEQHRDYATTGGGSSAYISGDKYCQDRDGDVESQEQQKQHTGELHPMPLCEVETPPDDSVMQRQGRGPAELGAWESAELAGDPVHAILGRANHGR